MSTEAVGVPAVGRAFVLIRWSSVLAGAFVASALFFVLLTFGASVGLAVASASPTWRDASFALWFLSGLYLLLSAIVCFAIGGYLGVRARAPMQPAPAAEVEFRDGLQGILVWAVAVLIGVVILASVGGSAVRRASGDLGAGNASAAESVLAYQIDRLFRSERRSPDLDMSQDRAEAGRILLMSSSHSGIPSDDRAYLVRLVGLRTGLAGADAERRVDDVIGRSRSALGRARASGVIVGFMTAASLLIGAVLAWWAAVFAGRERDGAVRFELDSFVPWVGARRRAD